MTRDDLLAAMLRECDLCIHLHGKIPAGGMEFRLSPSQRSTADLLRYLSFIGIGCVRCIVAGSWDPYEGLEKEAAALDPAGFPAAMERQKAALREAFAALTEEDLRKRTFDLPWGEAAPLGRAILEFGYACLVAYRMQLFLHAKAAGNGAIGTSNCWGGRDTPARG